jgi:hypothetical protein
VTYANNAGLYKLGMDRILSRDVRREQSTQLILWFVLIFLGSACTPVADSTNNPFPQALATEVPTDVQTQAPQPQAEHRIGIRRVNGKAEFYDKLTGETFVVRGANYAFTPTGSVPLFRVGSYDPQLTRQDFAILALQDYNTVHVFLDMCASGTGCVGDADNVGLNPEFLADLADITRAARDAGIYVLFTSNDIPDQGGYSQEANQGSGGDFAGYRNSYYLRPQSVSATRHYWRDVVTGLAEQGAAFDAILGWELVEEQWMFLDQAPLSLTRGTVETTTGSYDMSDAHQKRQMVTDGMRFYIAEVKKEILKYDPTALVTMGFFVPELVAPDWYVDTAPLLQDSDLDFFDFHGYPGPISLQAHAEAFGMLGYDYKPIILGEYGAFTHLYPDINSAARVLTNWVADSCQLGFDGWLYWAYRPANASFNDRTWGLTDEDGFLLNLLSPIHQQDPCVPVDLASGNIAYGKPVRVSAAVPDQPGSYAVDEDAATQWSSGEGPGQWIEIDLQGLFNISEVKLLVAQYPAGNTVHRVQVRANSSNDYSTVYEFSGSTNDNDWLVFTPDSPLQNVGFIRIQTVTSPSWVAWKEIQVFGDPID